MKSAPTSMRFLFSQASDADRNWLMSLYTDSKTMEMIPGGTMTREHATEVCERAVALSNNPVLGYWIARQRSTSTPVGYVVLREFGWDKQFQGTEIGYIIDRAHWGQGVASEAVEAVTNFAMKASGIKKLLALVNDKNAPSIRIVQKLGFKCNHIKPVNHPDNSVWELTAA